MKFLRQEECIDWCRAHNYLFNQDGLETHRDYPLVDFSIPADAGARAWLCRLLWNTATSSVEGDYLIWTTEWSVWPSGEHMPLYLRLRQALGDHRPLEEAPGCLCKPGELDDGLSLLLINGLFLWDCWVLSETGTAVFLSHDEVGTVFSPDAEVRSAIASEVSRLRIGASR